jgi:hypothetical protein
MWFLSLCSIHHDFRVNVPLCSVVCSKRGVSYVAERNWPVRALNEHRRRCCILSRYIIIVLLLFLVLFLYLSNSAYFHVVNSSYIRCCESLWKLLWVLTYILNECNTKWNWLFILLFLILEWKKVNGCM